MEEQTSIVESVVMPFVRHAAQFAGASLVTSGVISANDVQGVVGGLVSIAAVAWGICRRKGFRICNL